MSIQGQPRGGQRTGVADASAASSNVVRPEAGAAALEQQASVAGGGMVAAGAEQSLHADRLGSGSAHAPTAITLRDFLLRDPVSARSRARRGDERALAAMQVPASQIAAVLAYFHPQAGEESFQREGWWAVPQPVDVYADDPVVKLARRISGHAVYGPLPEQAKGDGGSPPRER